MKHLEFNKSSLRIYLSAAALWLAVSAPLWAAKNPGPAEGWKAFREKRYADAIQAAEKVLIKKPNDEDAHWLEAEVALAQKDTATSLTKWYAVLNSNPVHPRAVMNLVEILLSKADTAGAQKILDAALEKKPELAEVSEFAYSQGLLLFAKGHDAEAMVKFSQAIDKNPEESHAYIALARVYKGKKVYPLVKQNFLKALALDSTNAAVHFELANVLMEMKEYTEALAHFKAARDNNADIPNVNYQIGKLYFYAEKHEQAVQELQIAMENATEDNFFLSSIYGQSLRALRRLEEAQGHLEKAYRLKPTDLSTARALAMNSFELKKYDKAIEVYKNIIGMPEAEPSDYARIGESYYNIAGKNDSTRAFYDSATVYLKKGYELSPDNSSSSVSRLAYMMGMAYFNLDQYDSAQVYFGKKVQADSTFFPAYFYLGYCCLKKEIYREAVTNLRRANQIDSTRVSVHMMLAQTLTFMDSSKAAKQEFRAVINLDSTQGDAYGGLGFIYLSEASNLPDNTEREAVKEAWGRAATYFRKATTIVTNNASYWLGLGQSSYYLEDYDTAERAFQRALQYDPNNKDASNGLETIEKVKSRKRLQ